MHFVGKGRFNSLASIPEALLGHELIHTFEELGVQSEGDFGFRHRSMMFHHTTGNVRPTDMQNKRLEVVVALVYILAWFLPVIEDGVTLPNGLPGWEAFRVALSPVWPYGDFKTSSWPWYWQVLSVLSGATNAVMVVLLALLIPGRSSLTRAMAWPAGLAFCINAQWCLRMDQLSDLRSGYWLWWLSFLGLLLVLMSARTRQNLAQRI